MKSEEEIIEELKTLAAKEGWLDVMGPYGCIDDYAGGNVDDAFYGGYDQGQIALARNLLNKMGVEFGR